MRPESLKYLEDMRQAALSILEFTAGRTEADYETDKFLRSAVDRQFEIIGEALNRTAKLDAATAFKITGYRRIIDFRNVLIHGYDIIEHGAVWGAVTDHLPLLLREVEALLRTD